MFPVAFTREQSRRVDQLAQQEYGFSGLVLMENAGRGVADVLCRLGIAGPVAICCGKGTTRATASSSPAISICAATRSACCCGPSRRS